MTLPDGIALGVLLSGLLFSIGRRKLTVPAALTGTLLGWVIYAGGGLTGLAMMTIFFVLGTAATSWRKNRLLSPFRGTFGNGIDSVLGAVFERGGRLTNNWVNFLNTLAAALLAGLLDTM